MVYKLLLFVSQLQGTVLYVCCSMLSSYLYILVVADWLKQWVAKIHSNIIMILFHKVSKFMWRQMGRIELYLSIFSWCDIGFGDVSSSKVKKMHFY